MNLQIKTLTLLFFLSIFCSSYSTYGQAFEDWKHYKSKLDARKVVDDGSSIWIRVKSGLVEFDKSSTEVATYNQNNSHPLVNEINDMVFDNKGVLWCTTDFGLLCYTGATWKLYDTLNSELSSLNLGSIVADNNDNLWIASHDYKNSTYFYKLLLFNSPNEVKIFDTSNSILEGRVRDLAIDNSGNLWIADSKLIKKDTNNNWTYWDESNSEIIKGGVGEISTGGEHLWFRNSFGLYYLSNGKVKSFTWDSDSIMPTRIEQMATNKNGELFYTQQLTYGSHCWPCAGGLKRFNIDSLSRIWIMNEKSVLQNELDGIYIEDNGTIWVASVYGRLFKLKNSKWSEYYLSEDSSFIENVNQVEFLSKQSPLMVHKSIPVPGSFLTTTYTVLSILNEDNNWVEKGHFNSLGETATNNHGTIYTKQNAGIISYNFDNDEVDTIGKFDFPLYSPNCCLELNQLAVNSDGSIIAFDRFGYYKSNLDGPPDMREGIGIIRNGNSILITSENSNFREGSGIVGIEIDLQNRIWIATAGTGLWLYEGDSLVNFNTNNSDIPFNLIHDVHIGFSDKIWIHNSSDFSSFNDSIWKSYKFLDGKNVQGFAEDTDSSVWLSDEYGNIYNYNYDTFLVYNGDNSPLSFYNWNPINNIDIDSLGNKWFSTHNGLFVYRKNGVVLPELPEQNRCIDSVIKHIKIYPNPVKNIAHVVLKTNRKSNYRVHILSISGKIVNRTNTRVLNTGKHCIDLDFSKYLPGTYLILIERNGSMYATRKVVKL